MVPPDCLIKFPSGVRLFALVRTVSVVN